MPSSLFSCDALSFQEQCDRRQMFDKQVNEVIMSAALQLMVDIFECVVDNLNVRQRFFNRENFIKTQNPDDQQVRILF